MRRSLLCAVSAAFLASCGGGSSSQVTTLASLGEQDQLGAATATTVLGETELTLDAFLWRDFMPPAPADGSDLMASITIRTTDGNPVPAGVDLVTLYVVNGDAVWVTGFSSEAPQQAPSQFEEVARGGPRWGPAIDVDVCVKLVDDSGDVAYLAARAQPITATY